MPRTRRRRPFWLRREIRRSRSARRARRRPPDGTPDTHNAALADTEYHSSTAGKNPHRSQRLRIRARERQLGLDTVIEAIPGHSKRARAARVVPVVVAPKTVPVLGRRVLSQRRSGRLIEHASRRVARNKIHPQYPSNPVCHFARIARVREVYDVQPSNATARDSVSH
jgi:hypothetical protein